MTGDGLEPVAAASLDDGFRRVPRPSRPAGDASGAQLQRPCAPQRTLPSVISQRIAGGTRVVVVDDASSDDSRALLRERWPDVAVVALAKNGGITAALNRGVQAANTEFVALLNNDVELADGWLASLVTALDAYAEAASATGKLLRYDDREVIDAAGDVLALVLSRLQPRLRRAGPRPVRRASGRLFRLRCRRSVSPRSIRRSWAVRRVIRGLPRGHRLGHASAAGRPHLSLRS